jgi:hypothetical protein
MVALEEIDEKEFLSLAPKHSPAHVKAALARIAKRHGAEVGSWASWKCGIASQQTPLSLSVCDLHSMSFQPLLAFAFGKSFAKLAKPADISMLFDSFLEALSLLERQGAGPRGGPASQTNDRMQAAVVSMFLASGPVGSRFAYAALRRIIPEHFRGPVDKAWSEAFAIVERAKIAPPVTKSAGRREGL